MALLVGTEDGLHRLDERTAGGSVELAGRTVGCVAQEGSDLWAVVDGNELWRSVEAEGWNLAASTPGPRLNCICPTGAGLLVGTSDAHLLRLDGGTLRPLDSFDQTPERDAWYTPWGGPADVRSISADGDGAIYVNVHVGGVVRSTDGGASWEPTLDIDVDVHQVLAPRGRAGLVLAAAGDGGLGVSQDGGDSWTFQTEGLHATYCRAVAVGGDTIFLSASASHRGQQAAVYRRPIDGTVPFERCTEGLPDWFDDNVDTFCLAASGGSAAIGTDDGGVFLLQNEGETWRSIATGLPPVRCLSFTG